MPFKVSDTTFVHDVWWHCHLIFRNCCQFCHKNGGLVIVVMFSAACQEVQAFPSPKSITLRRSWQDFISSPKHITICWSVSNFKAGKSRILHSDSGLYLSMCYNTLPVIWDLELQGNSTWMFSCSSSGSVISKKYHLLVKLIKIKTLSNFPPRGLSTRKTQNFAFWHWILAL